MDLRRRLLAALMRENPFQPATSWWRSIELAVVIEHGLPAGRGLDLGCGDGKLMQVLLDAAQVSRALVGIDIDPQETRDAETAGVYERVHTAPAADIPERSGAFDFVFSNSVLEHIDDLEPVLAEVARLLRPGGVFLFTVPGEDFHACLAGPLLPWTARQRYLDVLDRRCAHRRYWSAAQWRDALGRNGIALEHALPYLSAAQVRRWETLSRYTAGVLYGLAGARAQPIQIQRALRLRERALRLPGAAARLAAAVIAAGAPGAGGERFGCLLVQGRKR